MSRWMKAGVLDRIFVRLQEAAIFHVRIEAVSLDSTSVRVHPNGCGALKKRPPIHRAIPWGRTTKLHLVAASARQAIIYCLSPGNEGDAPWGRELLHRIGKLPALCHLLMDRAYEGDETRLLAESLGFLPVVPPNPNRKEPWDYDTELYKRRNEVERLFRRLKAYRRIFTRYDKLDVIFLGCITFALIIEGLRLC